MKRLFAILAVIIIWAASTDSQQPYAETQSAAAPDCGIDGFYVWRETFPEFDDLTDSAVAWRMQIRPWSLGQAEAEIWAEEWRLFMPAEYHQLGANEVLACMSQMGAAFSSYNQAIEPARPRI